MDEQFQKDLEIHLGDLEHDCVNQPKLFAKYGRIHADAIKRRDTIKSKRKVLKAQVEKEIRLAEDPSVFGINKITDKSVEAAIESHPEIIKVEKQLIEAEHIVNILSVAIESFRDKRSQLSNLVQLYHDQYWAQSEPKVSQEVRERIDQNFEEEMNDYLNQEWEEDFMDNKEYLGEIE